VKKSKKYLRPDEVAWELSVSTRTIYRLIADGELLAFSVRKGGAVRIPRASFERYVKDRIEDYQLEGGIVTGDDTKIF